MPQFFLTHVWVGGLGHLVKPLQNRNEELLRFPKNPLRILDEQPKVDSAHHDLTLQVRVHNLKVIRKLLGGSNAECEVTVQT